jgi:tRNA modification GTPase
MRRILRRALDAGARMAEAGEFSKRAFLNGKMDLIQAEAVADLIHAKSERAAAAAVEQMDGSLSRKFDTVYDGLMTIAADLEATLDFLEDELPEDTLPTLATRLTSELGDLDKLLATWDEGRLLREGVRVVILGRPNAGKSTLLNLLLGFERAIVSNIEGTTRDLIEEGFSLDGIPLRIIDTAGLRETDCAIEQEGIRRAHASFEGAHLPLYIIDASVPLHAENLNHFEKLKRKNTIIILNKVDQCPDGIPTETLRILEGFTLVEASLIENRGATAIKKALMQKLEGDLDLSAPPHAVISERHRQLLAHAQYEGQQGLELLQSGDEMQISFVGQHLRSALELIGEATGKVYHDSLLDMIFSRFCVGK